MEVSTIAHICTSVIASVMDADKLLFLIFGSSSYVIFNKALVLKALKCLIK